MAPTHTDLVERNRAYAQTHQALPTIAEIQATGAKPPKTCIITCVDPRVFPEVIFALQVGEAFTFRTIAGRPQTVFENIVALDAQSHGFEDLILLYHTDCGACYFEEDRILSELAETDPSVHVQNLNIGIVKTSIEQCLENDVKWLKQQQLVRSSLTQAVRGIMYDIKSGKVHQVV